MRKLMFASLLVCLSFLISSLPALADSDEDSILIYPWVVPPDENGDHIITVTADQEVILGARWGVCRRGQLKAFLSAVHLDWTLDGQPLFTSQDQVAAYWSPLTQLPATPEQAEWCIGGSETIWRVFWSYSLGTLDVGDHPVHLHYWLDHQVTDGFDGDGDGKPDLYNGTVLDPEIIIRVEPSAP